FATAPSIVRSTGILEQPQSGSATGSGLDRLEGRAAGARSLRGALRVALTFANRRAPISASTAGSNAAASVRCAGVPLCWSRFALVRRFARASSDISGSLVSKSIPFLLASGPPPLRTRHRLVHGKRCGAVFRGNPERGLIYRHCVWHELAAGRT